MRHMQIRSAAFSDHTFIPGEYSHQAGDISPPLEWSDVPDEAVELVLTCDDPDAPGEAFVHWLLAAIPPETGSVEPGEPPTGSVAGRNDFGGPGYGGPHPPPGDEAHRYFFRLRALSEPSGLGSGFTPQDLRDAIEEKVIATGNLVGLYQR